MTHRRILRWLGIVAVIATLLLAIIATHLPATTHASSHPHVSVLAQEHQVGRPGSHTEALTATPTLSCGASAVKGNLLINATEKVINDADSGQAGNYWALDAFTRTLKVWNTGSDQYCAAVKYNGTFAAQVGQQSPGSTATTGGTLTGDEVGTFAGGYVAQITGPLFVSDAANWPLAGLVTAGNPVDYQCTIDPSGTATCPGMVDWTTKYFDTSSASFSFNESPWGWTYTGHDSATAPDAGKADGVWHNASTGNSGDILDID